MTADRAMAQTLGWTFKEDEIDDVKKTYREWTHLANGVSLFGTEEVRAAEQRLVEAYATVEEELQPHQSAATDAAAVAAAYQARRDEIDAARDALLEAMRRDVTPEARERGLKPEG